VSGKGKGGARFFRHQLGGDDKAQKELKEEGKKALKKDRFLNFVEEQENIR